MHGFEDRGAQVRRGRFIEAGRFGRMFPYLRSLKAYSPGAEELGKPGGVMDGGDAGDGSQDNSEIKAGYTFLGQFIDHDITFDPTSILEQQIDPGATRNFRTPVLELDSVYGQGPGQQPYLYDQDKPFRFLVDANDHDLPRNAQGRALIGDPRNDENTIISQLHLLFLKFHNKVYEDLAPCGRDSRDRFEEAQRIVRWHYQWIVRREFLERLVGADAIETEIVRPSFRFGEDPFMPVEFSVAAYRFGHSQVRAGYRLSGDGEQPPRIGLLFPGQPGGETPAQGVVVGDLRGGRPVADSHRIHWSAFFGPTAQQSHLIDQRLSPPLLNLPFSVVPPEHDEGQDTGQRRPIVGSLATRNLQRGEDAALPSGQNVAAHLGIDPLSDADVWDGVTDGNGETPLWYYVLREAAVKAEGKQLAGVGATIVSKVFAALLHADKASYVVQQPGWTPTLPSSTRGQFTLSDLVNYTLGECLGQENRSSPTPMAAE